MPPASTDKKTSKVKASTKSPTAPRKTAKRPNQSRSKAKVEAILQAAEDLLGEASLEDIGPYEIAKKAGVPAASVYYFFPTIDDLWADLTKIHAEKAILLKETSNRSVSCNWQTLFAQDWAEMVNYYNSNHACAELLLGPNTSREVCKSCDESNVKSAEIAVQLLTHYYMLPEIPELTFKLDCAITAAEAVLAKSYRNEGHISTAMHKEAERVLISYMRSVLPDELTLREHSASDDTEA